MIFHRTNCHNTLKNVVLGQFYTSDYFHEVDSRRVKSALTQISDEIQQDLENFETLLKSAGVDVLRPELPSYDQFWQHHARTHKFLTPPMQPRNHYSVIGDKIFRLQHTDQHIDRCIQQHNPDIVDLVDANNTHFQQEIDKHHACLDSKKGIWYRKQKYLELAGPDWPHFHDYVRGERSSIPSIQQELDHFQSVLQYASTDFGAIDGPNLFPIDSGLVIDAVEYCDYEPWLRTHVGYQDKIIKINTGAGHTDGCFSVLGHQVILGIDPLIDYQQAFPGHDVIAVSPENYMNHISGFREMQHKVRGKWWVPGQEHNNDFIYYVEKYMSDWTGYVQETVFDVNVLSLDSDTVFVTSDNADLLRQLSRHGIEPIVVPWRHRFFVDGGLHCITLDLCRA